MYKILVTSKWELSVCVGTYETYEAAKEQMKKMIVHLITHNDPYQEGEWEAWKKQFPKEVQSVLTSLEQNGIAPAGEYDMDAEVGNNWFVLRDNDLDIDEADDPEETPAYKLSTNLFETGEEAEARGFSLCRGDDNLIIMMLSEEDED